MPALGRRLGCGAMSLYGHVASKDDLLEAVAERAFGTVPMPQPLPGDVGAILYAWGRGVRAVLEAHPHISVILLRQAVVGPGILRGAEHLLRALTSAGCAPETGVHALYAILVYSLGSLAWELPRTREQPQRAYAAKWRQVVAGLPEDEFPVVGSVIDELGRVAGAEQFEFGLGALVHGLTAAAGKE
jgi:AcrR family transcriptional regulator